MRAHNHRLVFWPLFIGFVVFLLSGDGIVSSPSSCTKVAIGVALFVLGLIYASDRTQPFSGGIRVLVLSVSVIATIYWLLMRDRVLYILAPLFFLIVALVIFGDDLTNRPHKRHSGA